MPFGKVTLRKTLNIADFHIIKPNVYRNNGDLHLKMEADLEIY